MSHPYAQSVQGQKARPHEGWGLIQGAGRKGMFFANNNNVMNVLSLRPPPSPPHDRLARLLHIVPCTCIASTPAMRVGVVEGGCRHAQKGCRHARERDSCCAWGWMVCVFIAPHPRTSLAAKQDLACPKATSVARTTYQFFVAWVVGRKQRQMCLICANSADEGVPPASSTPP